MIRWLKQPRMVETATDVPMESKHGCSLPNCVAAPLYCDHAFDPTKPTVPRTALYLSDTLPARALGCTA